MKKVWFKVPIPWHRVVLAAPLPPLRQGMVCLSPPLLTLCQVPDPFRFLNFDTPAVCRLIQRVFSLSDRSSLIESVFSTKDGSNMVRDLGEDDAQSFIDVIDEVPSTLACSERFIGTDACALCLQALMDAPDLPPLIRKKCLKSLYRTCGRHAFLPTAMKTLVQYDRMGSALYRGGFADVWKGKHCGREVAVKVIRTYTSGDLQKVIGVSSRPCYLSRLVS